MSYYRRRKILKKEEGIIFILFAVMAVPFFALLMYAIDITFASYYKAKLGYSTDFAAIAAARYDISKVEENASKIFNANFMEEEAAFNVAVSDNNDSVTVTSSYEIGAFLPDLLGIDSWNPTETVTVGRRSGGAEVAVTYNIYDMGDLDTLKQSSKNSLDYIFRNKTEDNLAAAIIPCCSEEDVLALTNNQETMESKIDSIMPQSQQIFNGVDFAKRTLTPGELVGDKETKDFNISKNMKSIIYVTTNNTIAPDFLTQCEEAKELGINIFVIGLNISNETSAINYQACASKNEWYFSTSTPDNFQEAFDYIAALALPIRVIN